MTAKVTFASPKWIETARSILTDLVAIHGEDGVKFTASEEFTNAPLDTVNTGTSVAWNFQIDGKTVTVDTGTLEGADLQVKVDYETALPLARKIYTEEMIKLARESAPVAGPGISMPPYLADLHNRLAVLTA